MNAINYYSLLASNGFEQPYNKVTIDHYRSSVQKLYRVNSGEWEIYNNETFVFYDGPAFANGFSFRNVNLNIIGKEVKSSSTLTISEGAEWIYYRLTADLVARFYEITPVNRVGEYYEKNINHINDNYIFIYNRMWL